MTLTLAPNATPEQLLEFNQESFGLNGADWSFIDNPKQWLALMKHLLEMRNRIDLYLVDGVQYFMAHFCQGEAGGWRKIRPTDYNPQHPTHEDIGKLLGRSPKTVRNWLNIARHYPPSLRPPRTIELSVYDACLVRGLSTEQSLYLIHEYEAAKLSGGYAGDKEGEFMPANRATLRRRAKSYAITAGKPDNQQDGQVPEYAATSHILPNLPSAGVKQLYEMLGLPTDWMPDGDKAITLTLQSLWLK